MGNKEQKKPPVRKLEAGQWYWVSRSVLRDHASQIGFAGIAVYNVLASFADGSQRCFPSQKYIAEILGCSRSTVSRAIEKLEKCGLIKKEKRDRYTCVYVLLKVDRCSFEETQMLHRCNSDVQNLHTNDNKLTIIKNDNDRGKDFGIRSFNPTNRKEILALDMAESLNDIENLKFYLSLVGKYPESFLRHVLGQVTEVPEEEIKRNRAALFNYLVQKKAKKKNF